VVLPGAHRPRTKHAAITAALAAQGVAGERLDSHVRLAQRNGLDYEALTAMMTLVTNYIGQARGSQAMEAVQRVAGLGSQTLPGNADVRHSSR
jgi:alkylhydroperoxidase/carboxymuconolactone decarboxylase family protein YurZ